MIDFDYFLRAFNSSSTNGRGRATNELAAYGADALPLLRSVLDGSAKNEFGVPYRNLGMPIDCTLVTIQMLGIVARPLEFLGSF